MEGLGIMEESKVTVEREVMVLPFNGDRESWGAVVVDSLEDEHGIAVAYRVSNGVGYSRVWFTDVAAFSDALAHAAWNAKVVARFSADGDELRWRESV